VTARQLTLLLVLAALWGASFMLIRIAVPALGPVALAGIRVVLAGLALLAWAAAIRALPRRTRRRRDYLLLGAVNAALPFALISAAELELTASTAAILNAMAPVFGAAVGALWFQQRIGEARGAGLLLGVAGVTLVVGLSPVELSLPFLLAVAASLGGALAYALGATLVKQRFAGESPLTLAIGQQFAAAAVLLPLIPLAPVREAPDAGVLAATAALAVACTSVAYLIYFRLIAETGPTSALSVTFLVPVFGVLWGALFLGEEIHAGTVIGGATILAGVLLVTGTRRRLPAHGHGRGRLDGLQAEHGGRAPHAGPLQGEQLPLQLGRARGDHVQ
jgi:drug/metabolite transporter (DMT)-like permease